MIRDAWQTAARELSRRRMALEAEREAMREKAVARDARIGELEVLIARALLRPRDGGDASALRAELGVRLEAIGLARDALDVRRVCPRCNDTLRDPETNRPCACVMDEYARQLVAQSGLQLRASDCFERYDETVYPETPVHGSVTQRAYMNRMRNLLETYANEYPDVLKINMVLTGASGLGKTFLLTCVTQRVLEKGVQCLLITAFQMGEVLRRAHMGAGGDEIGLLMTVPLLCIDDLGTEPLYENVTINYLFNVLNERGRADLGTMVATNLSAAELKTRYTERVFSRLCSEETTTTLPFVGQDVRISGKK